LDSDVDSSIEERTSTIRVFLRDVRGGNRAAWIAGFYGMNAPHSRLGEKDDADVIEDILSRHDSWTRHIYHCPLCERAYVQVRPGANEVRRDFRCYTPEQQ
jgi:hypothetical protein